jgi:hypothetical protein
MIRTPPPISILFRGVIENVYLDTYPAPATLYVIAALRMVEAVFVAMVIPLWALLMTL